MALVSPGVEVTVIDESQYIPSAVNTVPYFLVATAQNKADAAGVGVAAGTTAANANKTYLITSQRDLAATFGVPFFYNTTTGTPINGYELEYGLLAAYSALGVTNRAYVQRVNIDLTELTASLSRHTVAAFAAAITAATIPGVTATSESNKLTIYADSAATNDGSTSTGGIVSIELGNVSSAALLSALGISATTYRAPDYLPAYSYQAPRWRTTDTNPAPTGSIWQNISAVGNGMSLNLKKYDATLDVFVSQTSNVYLYDGSANAALDPTGGGKNIPVGTTYVQYDAEQYVTTPVANAAFTIWERIALGATVVTGTTTPGSGGDALFVVGNTFNLYSTSAGSSTLTQYAVTLSGTSVASFITSVGAANIPNVSASVNSAGNIVFTHSQGGTIVLEPVGGGGTPIATAGFTTSTPKVHSSSTAPTILTLSNWVGTDLFTYVASDSAPDQDPANGRLWYYSSVSDVDIMIQDNGSWQGYQNVTNDTRGFDLSLTNESGPIVSATEPTTQNDAAESPLVYGDIWLDTSDLENYPVLYRWQPVDGQDQWVLINNTDQVSSDGILFADARWAGNGTTDPVSDPFPSIESLLTSNYLDLDAPDPALYPQGMLMWNMRRSGYNVKSFQSNYFNATSFPDDVLPTVKSTWLTASGLRDDGAMYAGRLAQRKLIVSAMKAGIDTSLAAREEQNQFNLIAAPAYPELLVNLVALSNERANTLFVVGDTPMRLPNTGNALVEHATNNGGLGVSTDDGLIISSPYSAVFYPSCQTTDLSGNTVVAPPTHMMVRTILRSDAVSYPWLAPAGTRRGVVDNATAIGYIDAQTGEFQQLAVGQSVRDILYENNINPITFIPGIGITNFGNKTRQGLTTALDRINVARLVAFLRGRLEEIGKLYLFEPNDQITRNEITNTVNSLMIDLIAKRAIYDYLVVCDLSNNTPARIDRNELWVDIAIEPVKAVEFIYIPLRIKNTGEISSGTAG
jgi:hypothetical protein